MTDRERSRSPDEDRNRSPPQNGGGEAPGNAGGGGGGEGGDAEGVKLYVGNLDYGKSCSARSARSALFD